MLRVPPIPICSEYDNAAHGAACVPCPAASVSQAASASVHGCSCVAGFEPGAGGLEHCVPCAPGFYKNATGNVVCSRCAADTYSFERGARNASPRPPFGFVQRCAVPAPSTMTATVCAAMTAGTNVTLHAAAARGTTQLLRYSFAETWGCTAQLNVSAAERISAPPPNQVLPCAPRPGAVFVRDIYIYTYIYV
jgi:hypothetical protein